MPINEVTYTDEKVKIFHANQNSRLKFSDLNTVSGSSLDDSTLQLLIKLTRDLHGIVNNDPAFLGLRVLSYTNTSPAQITSEKGAIVTTDAIYRIPSLTLLPSADAFWGFYEVELVDTYGDNETQDVFDGLSLSYVNNPTRKIFSIRIYENYSTSASFPTLTPGRIKWIEYKKSSQGISGTIVTDGVTNDITPALTLQDLSNRIEEVNDDLDLHKADTTNPHDVGMSQLINNTANGNILMSGTHRVKELPVPVDSGDAVPSGYLNTQLDLKINFSTRGQPNGVATLSSENPGRLEQRVDWSKIDGVPTINEWLPNASVILNGGNTTSSNVTWGQITLLVTRNNNVYIFSFTGFFTKVSGISKIFFDRNIILNLFGISGLPISMCSGTVSHDWANAPGYWGGVSSSGTNIIITLAHGGDLTSNIFGSGMLITG